MAAAAEFKIDTKALEKAVKQVPKQLHKELAGAFNRALVQFEVAMLDQMSGHVSPPWFDNQGDSLASRSGNLRNSLGFDVQPGLRLSELTGKAYIGDAKTPYASTQEYGATITGSPWLTIPLPDNLTASGVPKYQSAAALRDDPSWNTWIQRSQAGNLIIRGIRDEDGPIQNLWILKQQVTIPPRLKFAQTFKGQRQRQIKLVNDGVTKALLQATRGTA